MGSHLLKAYSKTQAVIAKSSGESELYGVIRASTESLGISTLLEDFGMVGVKVRVGMDASAAMGIVQRRGLNKLRHVELDVLWIQEQQARRLMPLRKVLGTQNPSDMMTKHVDQSHIETYLDLLGLRYAEGRAGIAQKLHYMGTKNGLTATTPSTSRSATGTHSTTAQLSTSRSAIGTSPATVPVRFCSPALFRSAAPGSVSQSVGV